ncbi:MAG TPA: GNAT family N-acetyltransferase [Pseudorhizobium sp.]|nr:GNAT family N-acetyltransferase [Pseudorhizobium sp.]
MSFILRDATPADLPAISAIYADSVLNGTASYELAPPGEAEMHERFSSITSKGYPYVVAEDPAGAVLGYAYASAFRTRPAYRWLVEDSVYLDPRARRKGIGRALLAELIARCTALGFRQMIAVIGGASPASIAIHQALGFRLCGTLTGTGFKHGSWLDTVLMQIELGDGTASDPDPAAYPGTLYGG